MTKALDITRQVTVARRQRGLTQSALASQIGCRQSAISMYERGHAKALAQSKVDAVLDFLEIEKPTTSAEESASAKSAGAPRYCPVFDCPSNSPYTVQDVLLCTPRPQPSSTGRHCAFCGELLERACPECGTAVNSGACCMQCGTPYVAAPPHLNGGNHTAWADSQRTRLRELGLG